VPPITEATLSRPIYVFGLIMALLYGSHLDDALADVFPGTVTGTFIERT
jgi:hypothetical protein